jgi:hypothetical protein
LGVKGLGGFPLVENLYASSTPETLVNPNLESKTGEKTITSKETDIRPTLSRPQELWLASLEYCESQGRSDLRILDTNGYYSYGAFQFQMYTFLSYGKQYGVLDKSLTIEEARGNKKDGPIYDVEIQKSIVIYMVEDGLDSQWYNCRKKFGRYPID